MELVLLCLSLLVHHGLTQEACRCLDPSLCGDPAGCDYKCQRGFAGLNCMEVNHGFNLSPDAPDIFDGDFSTCRKYKGRINFSHPIDIDKIRIHRRNKNTGIFFAHLYKGRTNVRTWDQPHYKRFTEGEAVAASFPLQTDVTAIRIDRLGTACEVELSDGTVSPKQPDKTTPKPRPTPAPKPRPRPTPAPTPTTTPTTRPTTRPTPTPTPTPSKAITCPANPCSGRGTCQIEGNSSVCICDDGYRGDRCESECQSGRYGDGCTQECPKNCKREICDHVDGSCECKPGWTGDQCTNQCPSNTYGVNCSSTCSVGCKNKCRRVDGQCNNGCKKGWWHSTNERICDKKCSKGRYGSRCGEYCSRNCKDGECNHVDGSCVCKPGWTGTRCSQKCQSRRYGSGCIQECAKSCKKRTCDHVDGRCECKPGWTGAQCTNKCSKGRYGSRCAGYCPINCKDGECNHVDGSCVCRPGWRGTRCSQTCAAGTYGLNCSSSCSSGCRHNRCNSETGRCKYDCEDGWTHSDNNQRCDAKQCSTGCAGECNRNGKCQRCKPGWTHSDASNPRCDRACSNGYHGQDCQQKCSERCENRCNSVDGSCTCIRGWTGRDCSQGCPRLYYGRGCTQRCSTNCKDGECDPADGSCLCKPGWTGSTCRTGCPRGKYGQNCTMTCSNGCSNTCDKVTGQCRCKAGWILGENLKCDKKCSAGRYGSNCDERCNEGCQTQHCNHVTGDCNSHCKDGWTGMSCQNKCRRGRYGARCSKLCGEHCRSCHHVSGSCEHNCEPGWFGENCDQNCPVGKYGKRCNSTCDKGCDTCDSTTGDCTGRCKEGWTGQNCGEQCPGVRYGKNCVNNCSVGCMSGVCDRVTGACQPCVKGWKHGDNNFRCDQVCETGTFGAGCGEKCSPYCYNTTCHHVHGACLSGECLDGWTGNNCRESTAQSSFPFAVIALVLFLLVLLIVLIVVYRRRKKNPRPAVKARKPLDIEVPLALREPVLGVDDADEVENEYANKPDPVSNTSVPLSGLKAYVASKKEIKETLLNEYAKLPQGLIAAHDISLTTENNPKNRFRGVYPYNHTLVPLNTAQGRPTYINANFIDGFAMKNMYIATQGPLPDTVADLWEMIWQYNIPVIVMLANILEDGKRRCEPYWPMETDPTVQTFGHISVSVADETHYSDFTVRTLRFSKGRHSRTLKHVHYTVWPDKGVPADTLSLVSLRQKVRSLCDFDLGPLLVHCSAGIGRTGTLIALDYLMEQADSQNRVDIFGTVWTLRGYRVKMVQTDVQYVFLHDCILDAVEYTQTPTPVKLFVDVCKRLNRESGSEQSPNLALNFKRLQETPVPVNTTRAAKDHNNLDKNRSKDILPGDLHRPYLMKPVAGRTDYINAVMASSYRRRNALILTQSPLQSTVVDFWRLIRDHNIERVVLLDNYTESDEDCGVFWPKGEQRCHFGPITISKSKCEQHNGFSLETLEYQESSPDVSENKTTAESVNLFRCTFWAQNQSLPESDSRMLCFLDFIRQWDSVTSPLVVVCRDGCTRSGLYCVLSNVLERLISEKEVAINNAIRRMRLVRGQVVSSKEQYKFLHDAVSTYILNFHDYSNV